MNNPSFWIQSSWRGDQTLEQICQRAKRNESKKNRKEDTSIGLVSLYALYGSWNQVPKADHSGLLRLFDVILHPLARRDTQYATGRVQVDTAEEDLESFCKNSDTELVFPCPPEKLPVIVLILRRSSMKEPEVRYLSALSSEKILNMWKLKTTALKEGHESIPEAAKKEIKEILHSFGLGAPTIPMEVPNSPISASHTSTALRIFISGDRMSVGKTSVCLGIIGSLVRMGYPTESLAYIKPATQNENPQLIQHYCDRLGIDCVSIGPIVYYRGFTRAFLEGETETSAEMLKKVEEAVDNLAEGKRIVIVDGVGFPAVGSICGTDNASVARASGYPSTDVDMKRRQPAGVILVGGPGVGGAVDAFNLNATYFERAKVPVLGAIFNKLSLEGFYSLANCRSAITSYFEQNEHQQSLARKAFGFVPLFPGIADESLTEKVYDYIKTFQDHVDIQGILDSAGKVLDQSLPVEMEIDEGTTVNNSVAIHRPAKRVKVAGKRGRSREEIEQTAIQSGAAPSA
jgi:dethiobiotin synthetase